MTDDRHRSSSNCDSSRRRFLRGVGALGLAGLGLPALSTSGSASGDDSGLEAFRVTGKEIVRTEITPESVTVHKRKISDDLRRRYGLTPPVLTKTESVERPAPGEDDLPERDTTTVEREWDTYYAKEAEWHEYFKGGEVGAAYHDPVEDQKPYGTWEYEAVDGGYEITAPMNVISEETTGAVTGVLLDAGWTDNVVQYDRHAWNSETYQFETQHKSVATGTFGFLGRHHLKMWEFEGYVSGSAHVDSSAPHEATSFEDAEQEIESIFDDASGWYGYEDYYDLDNGGHLDHDGQATKLINY
jgi:hypothetical protein